MTPPPPVRASPKGPPADQPLPAGVPTRETLPALLRGWPTLPTDTVGTLLRHPDERILLRLLSPHRAFPASVQAALLARALRDADAAGELWTPVLGALMDAMAWPSEAAYAAALPEAAAAGWLATPAADAPAWVSAGARVARLRPWVEAQTDPRAFDALLASHSGALWELVARHGRLDAALVAVLVRYPGNALLLAPREDLPPDAVPGLARWGARQIASGRYQFTWDPRGEVECCHAGDGGRALTALLQAGHAVPRDVVDTLLALFEPPASGTPAYMQGHGRVNCEHPAYVRHQNALNALVDGAIALTDAEWRRAWDAVGAERGLAADLLRHPTVSSDAVAGALATSRLTSLREAVAGHPRHRRHPRIRALLAKSTATGVVCGLAADAEPAEFRRQLARALRRDPATAAALLVASTPAQRAALARADLEPFLRHPEAAARRLAGMLLPAKALAARRGPG